MNEDVFNASIRKFLEEARCDSPARDREGGAAGLWRRANRRATRGSRAEATVTLGGTGLRSKIKGDIELE